MNRCVSVGQAGMPGPSPAVVRSEGKPASCADGFSGQDLDSRPLAPAWYFLECERVLYGVHIRGNTIPSPSRQNRALEIGLGDKEKMREEEGVRAMPALEKAQALGLAKVRDADKPLAQSREPSPASLTCFLREHGCPPTRTHTEPTLTAGLGLPAPSSGPSLSGPSPLHPGMLFWELVTSLDPAFISGTKLLPQ